MLSSSTRSDISDVSAVMKPAYVLTSLALQFGSRRLRVNESQVKAEEGREASAKEKSRPLQSSQPTYHHHLFVASHCYREFPRFCVLLKHIAGISCPLPLSLLRHTLTWRVAYQT